MGGKRGQVWIAGVSDVGRVRSRNEDGMWLADVFVRTGVRTRVVEPRDPVVVAVADGVGGAAAGDVASRFVLERFARELPVPRIDEQAIRATATEVNNALVRQALQNPSHSGMATTLTGVVISESDVYWFNAGDSRLYRVRDHLTQVSRDHTLRELMGDPSIPGNIIANCFGGESDFSIDVAPLPDEDRCLLLCSDGVSDYANPTELQEAAALAGDAADVEELAGVANRVVEAALAGGGGDNATCILVRIVES